MTKPRLTQDQHTEFGARLAGIRDEVQRLGTQLANAYPRSGPEAVPQKHLKNALDEIEETRVQMERLCFGEHPRTSETTDYYPHREDRARVALPRSR